jgi:NAD(P)-dependent dehydrogenase (short-subunit alcohol dehydrogenase family)
MSPLPAQVQNFPGLEANMHPKPNYLAPRYKGADKLLDQVALITGGDSGIGRSVAVLFAREGADVAIVYLPSEQVDAEEIKRAIEHECRRAILIPGDVTDAAFCQRSVERTVQELGKLDILVNNAAYQNASESLDELSPEQMGLDISD